MLNNPFYKRVLDGSLDVSDVEGYDPEVFKERLKDVVNGTNTNGYVVRHHEPDLDEVFQRASIKILEKPLKVQEARKPDRFVGRICHNEAANFLSRQGDWTGTKKSLSRIPVDELSEQLPAPGVSARESDTERTGSIQSLLDDLQRRFPDQLDILRCRYDPTNPKSVHETARVLGIKESQVHYAGRVVRDHLRTFHEDDRRRLFGPHRTKRR